MAIGLARMFGVSLPRNFLYPYISRNPREFWQRWHITLSRWLRDYLYVSLGGSRVSFARNQINLLTTMLLGGLWHGAAWTFVIWGLIHGLWLVAHRFLLRLYELMGVERKPALLRAISIAGWPVTMAVVAFTWVFFRATSVEGALQMCTAMLGISGTVSSELALRNFEKLVIAAGAFFALSEPLIVKWCAERKVALRWWSLHPLIRGGSYAALVLTLVIFGGSPQKFIYFDF
jgi:D-alanyl-lipoteichoic acid acyltransferase DltB (MBOAT superfamily)